MLISGEVWVLPEISGRPEEVTKTSLGLLTEARLAAQRLNGALTALVFGKDVSDYGDLLRNYGVQRAVYFKHSLLEYPSAVYLAQALKGLKRGRPGLFILGHSVLGREIAPLIAADWNCGIAPNCVKIEFGDTAPAGFFRPVLGGQAYEEVVFKGDLTRLVTLNLPALSVLPAARPASLDVDVVEPELLADPRVGHLAFLPADFQTVALEEAEVVVGAGAGALSAEILPLVKELARLVEGSLGGTRPAVDEGQIDRERLIGQTGKVISPELYLALGVSGASHHLGGVQEARKIVAINRDARAEIFKASDSGAVADLKEVLPLLIDKIKQARKDGKII
jgi:electron transfer flavoprotein alpha subunit